MLEITQQKKLALLYHKIIGRGITQYAIRTKRCEKLFEELSIKGEDMQPTRHPKIGIWNNIPMDRDRLRVGINKLLIVAEMQNYNEIVRKIKELVPEYIGDNNKT